MLKQTVADEVQIACDLCEEAVPIGQTVLREPDVRVCWMCYSDETIGPDDDEEDDWDVDWQDEWDDAFYV